MQLLVGLVIAIVTIGWVVRKVRDREKYRELGLDSGDYGTAHARKGSFDESYFVNPKSGKFQFPKYRSSKDALVKVVDSTNYREDIWADLESWEKKDFGIKDFEYHFIAAEIEIEPFRAIFQKRSNPFFTTYGFLRGQGDQLDLLLDEIEESDTSERDSIGTSFVFAEDKFRKTLLKGGYLRSVEFETPYAEDTCRRFYLQSLKVDVLKSLCKTASLPTTLRKSELVDQLVSSDSVASIPVAVEKTEKFDELMRALYDAYVDDIRRTVDSWHPAIIKDVWEMVSTDAECEAVEKRADAILREKYWADRIV